MVRQLILSTVVATAHAESMTCGSGVPLCGVVTLESGMGSGNYQHDAPVVHGLWPQVDSYGTSQCIAPGDKTDPSKIYSCYKQPNVADADDLSFMIHEWEKHGYCAGVKDADDFFTQVCSLTDSPLSVMAQSRQSGGDLAAMRKAIEAAGYEVFGEDDANSQLELSACAGSDGRWKLGKVSEFGSLCGGGSPTPSPSPTPAPSPSPTGQCVASQHGPACKSDSDCNGVTGCVRCASSGYCTDVPSIMV